MLSFYPEGGNVDQDYKTKLVQIIQNDFDTPNAIALVWTMLKDTNISDADKRATILDFDNVLGLRLNEAIDVVVPEDVEILIEERNKARESKDWASSDLIREKIEALGYTVKDTDKGTRVLKSI